MVAVDTNVIVRLLTRDDELQFIKSLKIFRAQDVFIADTVILETESVLRFAYQFKPTKICKAFRNLFGLPNAHLANASLIAQALQWYEAGLDFADAFHLAQGQQCTDLYTFDDKFVKKAKGLTTCGVKKP